MEFIGFLFWLGGAYWSLTNRDKCPEASWLDCIAWPWELGERIAKWSWTGRW